MYNFPIDYGIFVAIISAAVFCITIPLKIMSEKHNKLKTKAEPQEREIKKKYGINPLGASVLENIENPNEEIVAMTDDEREQHAAEEIEELYRQVGYKRWTGWIPGAVDVLCIIGMLICFSVFCPEGIYKHAALTQVFKGEAVTALNVVYIGFISSELIYLIVNYITTGRKQHIAAMLITNIVAIGLSIWIAFSAAPASLIAIGILRLGSAIYNAIASIFKGEKNDKNNNNNGGTCRT